MDWLEYNRAIEPFGLGSEQYSFCDLSLGTVRNLASHVLGQAARRIEKDWQERWNYRPVLLETFVDSRFYEGTCYRAANWRYLGMTVGEGLVRKGRCYTTSPKKIWLIAD